MVPAAAAQVPAAADREHTPAEQVVVLANLALVIIPAAVAAAEPLCLDKAAQEIAAGTCIRAALTAVCVQAAAAAQAAARIPAAAAAEQALHMYTTLLQ